MALAISYIPGENAIMRLPLGRYLPPVPTRMVGRWLGHKLPKGAWILDPLGSTPQLALEAAQAGYCVLVASNNPILSFMLEILAQRPSRDAFQAALADLISLRRGEERLETHFRSLYQCECASCHQYVQPQAFLWKRGEHQPYARLVHCPHCGADGEQPMQESDGDRLKLPGNPNLHRARALERIAPLDDPIREVAQEAIQFFLPRPLYALTTLINRIEGLAVHEERRRLLYALALSVCDDATVLWPYPEARSRPRQLTTPPQFRENNLWLALESALEDWCQPGSPVKLTHWPELPPPEGGICLFSGRLKALYPLPDQLSIQAAAMIMPRPNQAFWTLSAIWSGWLWGYEAVAPLRNALERQRYDWHWHAQALSSIFSLLSKNARGDFRVMGLIPEAVPGFLSAAVLAAEANGMQLDGEAFCHDDEMAQLQWMPVKAGPSKDLGQRIDAVITEAVRSQLSITAEPSPYLPLHAASLQALAGQKLLPSGTEKLVGDVLTRLQNSFNSVFKDGNFLRRYERQASQNIETGLWWFAQPPSNIDQPFTDRVEMILVRWLLANPNRTLDEILYGVSSNFSGLLFPSRELIRICLDSYAVSSGAEPPTWQVRPSEIPAVRRQDLEIVRSGLMRLGKKLGFAPRGEIPIQWNDPGGEVAYQVYPLASALISRYVFQPQAIPLKRCLLVVPGSRINLILYKLRINPFLNEAVGAGWRFMKFRQLREMLKQPNLDLELFEKMLSADPARWDEATQLSIL